MFYHFKQYIYRIIKKYVLRSFPELLIAQDKRLWNTLQFVQNNHRELSKGKNVKIFTPSWIYDTIIGDYTYIATNAHISQTNIGKFCSIGPNLVCGWGIHPTYGISTHPMFYSTMKQNGMTLSTTNKVEERKKIEIGNDVFIGANVTILDGITIGDGAVIGAGAVVSKDIPPYAVAVGCPIRIIKYRFTKENIDKLKKIRWWDFDENKLKEVEVGEFEPEQFIINQTTYTQTQQT